MSKRIGVVGWHKATIVAPPGTAATIPTLKDTRIDCGDGIESWEGKIRSLLELAKADGIQVLALYNPRPWKFDPVAFRSLCEACKANGVTVVEFGNEVWTETSAVPYGEDWAKAQPIAQAHGIKLVFTATGDYYDPVAKRWSQVEGKGGWLVDAAKVIGRVPAAVTLHPYGQVFATNPVGGGNPVGFESIITMADFYVKVLGHTPKIWVTEYGEPTFKGSDGNAPVTSAEQAEIVKDVIEQAAALPFVEALYWFAVTDGNEGGYGLFTTDWKAKPSAAAFKQALERINI